MKNISKYLVLLVAVLFSFTACEQDIKRDPSPIFETANSVFFPVSSLSKEFDPSDTFEQIVAIQRDTTNIDSALVVKLNVATNTEEVFEVPATVAFAKGEAKTSFTVKFPNAQIDSLYTLVIELDADKSNPYLDAKPTFTFKATVAKWNDVTDKKAIIFDGIVNAFFSVEAVGWYVPYQRKDNADESFDIRLLNPYATLAANQDNFGIFDGYPYNEAGNIVAGGPYNMVIHVDKDGEATFDLFELGIDYGYGMFSARFYDPEIPGVWNKEEKSITFPAQSSASFMANYGGRLTSNDIIVHIDDSLYQDIHSVITVASLKGGCNDPSLEWDTIPGELSTLVSKVQPEPGLIEVRLENSIDPNPIDKQGKGSDFFNLYRLTDVYAKGYCLAFYWDTIKNEVKMPLFLQPTGLKFAGKDIYVGQGTTDCYLEEATLGGKPAKIFHLFMQLQTKDGGNLGEYEEVYYYCDQKIIWGDKAEDFVGTYKMTGPSQWAGKPAAAMNVEIKQDSDALYILGIKYADTVWVDFDDTNKTLSIAPQVLGNYGPYDITLYTSTEEGASVTEPIVLSMQFGGIISINESSLADGYYLVSQEAGGAVDGYYDLKFTPAAPAAAAPAKAPAVSIKSGEMATHERVVVAPKTADFKFQGKVSKHTFRLKD